MSSGQDPNIDESFAKSLETILSDGDVITLDFEEVEDIRQPFGTRVENVTPFLVTFLPFVVALVPETDVWIDTQTLEPHNVEFENDLFDSMKPLVLKSLRILMETELVFLQLSGILGRPLELMLTKNLMLMLAPTR